MIRLVVFPWHNGLRLDQFLAAATPLSRRRCRSLLADGEVARNGQVSRVMARPVATGEVIDLLSLPPTSELPARPDVPLVHLAYRDDWLVFAEKPPGVLSQPAEERAPGELALDERLLLQLALEAGRKPCLQLVHRLDRGTSGLLLFAANPAAHAPLARAWREGQVERRYLAVVEGCPAFEELRVEAPIARSADGAWRFEARADGKPARTEVRVVVRGEQESLLACRLSTGRTHQVRVHLASVGHPVVGDRLYGAREGSAGRPLLHAAEISLPHPKTGEPLRVSSPLPPEMAERLPAGSGLGLVQ